MVSSMIEVRLEDMFDEYGIYNVNDIICSFDKYLGYDFSDLFSKFETIEEKIVTRDEVISYCMCNYDKLDESRFSDNVNMRVVKKRVDDYRHFCKILDIYKYKGLKYLSLISYLKSLDNGKIDEKNEKLLIELDISHYKSIVCGRDLIKLLNALGNTIIKCDETISIVNDMNTYHSHNFDSLALGSDEVYPRHSLVNDDRYLDRTSISVNNKKRKIRML